MNTWYKNKIILAVVVLVLVVVGYLLFKGNSEVNSYADMTEVRSGEIKVEGVISCLPYRIATAGAECVKSLKGDDGKDYALSSADVKGVENTMSEGTKVTAVGVFEQADTSVDDSSVFRYDGVIVLRTLKTR